MEHLSPWFVSQVAILAFALFGAVASLTSIYKNVRGVSPQPLRVQGEPEYVTVAHCNATHDRNLREHGELHSRIGGVDRGAKANVDSLRLELKSDFKGVHDRINDVLAAVSELRGEIKRIGS